MSHNHRNRLDKLERWEPDDRISLWDAVMGDLLPDQVPPAVLAQWERMRAEAEAARRLALERSPAGVLVRAELRRLGLPQPADLLALDGPHGGIIDEALRLAALPPSADGAGNTIDK